jgi:hypothetical protein
MKIMISSYCPRSIHSIGQVLASLGESVTTWTPTTKPIYDMFYEKEPDVLFLGQQDMQEPSNYAAIMEHKNVKVVSCGAFMDDVLDDTAFINLAICQPGIPPTLLKNVADNVPVEQLQVAANLIECRQGNYNGELVYDVFYHSSEPDTSILSPRYIELFEKFGARIAGPSQIPINQYMGNLKTQTKYDIFSSAKIIICDNLDDAYNALYCGSLPLVIRGAAKQIPEIFDTFSSEDQLDTHLSKFLGSEKARRKTIKQKRKSIVETETYFDRLNEIAEYVNPSWKEQSTLTKERLMA